MPLQMKYVYDTVKAPEVLCPAHSSQLPANSLHQNTNFAAMTYHCIPVYNTNN